MNSLIFEELQVLSEIFKNLRFFRSPIDNNIYGSFEADIKLTELKDVIVIDGERSFNVSHFPDLVLNFQIFGDSITYDIDCVWLSRVMKAKIVSKLKSMESDRDEIFWRWFQFLELECLQYIFDVSSDQNIEINTNYMSEDDLIQNDKLFNFFHQYDHDKKQSVFKSSIFECGSCLSNKRGVNCIRMKNCQDMFCDQCASGYFNTQIKNGDLELKCLICSGKVEYDEIKCILSEESFTRWDQLVLKQYLKSSNTASPCPRCETMSPVDDNCGLCPKCTFAFCTRCTDAYHSGFDCQQDHACLKCGALCKVSGKRAYCRKCDYEFCGRCGYYYHEGTSCIKVTDIMLRKNMKLCPNCKEGYEKTGGCNKMTCPSCRVYFCDYCGKIIDGRLPYAHFGVLPQCPLT